MKEILFYESVHSPDDGGYYAEVIRKDGSTLHQTVITDDESTACEIARRWIFASGYTCGGRLH